jgi:hypothetical protein
VAVIAAGFAPVAENVMMAASERWAKAAQIVTMNRDLFMEGLPSVTPVLT